MCICDRMEAIGDRIVDLECKIGDIEESIETATGEQRLNLEYKRDLAAMKLADLRIQMEVLDELTQAEMCCS